MRSWVLRFFNTDSGTVLHKIEFRKTRGVTRQSSKHNPTEQEEHEKTTRICPTTYLILSLLCQQAARYIQGGKRTKDGEAALYLSYSPTLNTKCSMIVGMVCVTERREGEEEVEGDGNGAAAKFKIEVKF